MCIRDRIWLRVPSTIKVNFEGSFREYVTAKDLILYVIGLIGASGATYKAVEFTGSTISRLSIGERMTLCNMTVEMGAKTGLINPDGKTLGYVEKLAKRPFEPLRSDPDADYEKTLEIDVNRLEPMIACPHAVDNVKPVRSVEDVKIDQAFIGSCTNGRIEDLRAAARILRGKRISKGVRMIVTPASRRVYLQALREGLIEIFIEAGALVTNPTCGACFGGHMGLLAPGEVCVSSSNRNFIGRMGSPKAEVYLASPVTVAASALAGRIVDPSEYLED